MTTQNLKIGQAGLNLIKKYETLQLKGYICPAGKLTIGYGHVILPTDYPLFNSFDKTSLTAFIQRSQRGQANPKALQITEAQAINLLAKDSQIAAEFVNSVVTVNLTQNQFDALVSFVFNVGCANFATSTLKRCLNQGKFANASLQFDRWIYGTVRGEKRRFPGLVTRRAEERTLFERK